MPSPVEDASEWIKAPHPTQLADSLSFFITPDFRPPFFFFFNLSYLTFGLSENESVSEQNMSNRPIKTQTISVPAFQLNRQ